MALKNSNQNYLKISTVDIMSGLIHIRGEIYQSEQVRRDGLSDFQATKQISASCERNTSMVTTGKTLTDELWTLGYNLLKSGEYKDWQDC
jgi:hypothetical protein